MNIAKTASGAALGFIAGSAFACVQVGVSLAAPITYPLNGAIQGYVISKSVKGDTVVQAASIIAGTITGVCTIPLAPLNILTAPVCTPIVGAIIGAFVVQE